MFINAILEKKEPYFKPQRCKIEKVVRLFEDEYAEFVNDMLKDYDFIKDKKDKMYRDKQGVVHCLLVIGTESTDGILVESGGTNLAIHSSFIPNINEYLQLKLKDIVDEIIKEGTEETATGNYIFSIEGLKEEYDFDIGSFTEEIAKELLEREEVCDVEIANEDINVNFYLDYCPNHQRYGFEDSKDITQQM